MTFHKNKSRFKFTLFLEYWKIKKELIKIYSHGTYMCMSCGCRDDLEIHHLQGDGDAERERWEIGTNNPSTMGYLYQMYFAYERDPIEAIKHYGVLCARCNKLDRDARQAEKKLQKTGQTKLSPVKAKNIIAVPQIVPKGKVLIFK